MLTPAKQQLIEKVSISGDTSLIDALKQMNCLQRRLLLVTKDGVYSGIISSGDLQRAIINKSELDTPVGHLIRPEIRVVTSASAYEDIKAEMLEHRVEFMPVVDSDGQLVDIHFWEDLFSSNSPETKLVDLPVVIMAGGKGTRLKPFSNIIPKPLFPIGDHTILEHILDRFEQQGCDRFYLSVNHKANFIRNYLNQKEIKKYNINVFEETKPLGTGGSLNLLKDHIKERFFVSNCDILIDADYADIVQFHEEGENEITIIAAVKEICIPYGTLEISEGGELVEFREKPQLNYLINTGFYLLEPHLLEEVPKDTFFHITELIEVVRERGGKVGVFPIAEDSWKDIGEWNEYRKTLNSFIF